MPIPTDGYAAHSAELIFYAAPPPDGQEFAVNLLFNLDFLADPGFAEKVIAAVDGAVTAAIAGAYPEHSVAGTAIFGGGIKSVALPLDQPAD